VEDKDVFGGNFVKSGDTFHGISGEVHKGLRGGEDYRRFFRISEDFFVYEEDFGNEFCIVF
jgi:hypothetical protein